MTATATSRVGDRQTHEGEGGGGCQRRGRGGGLKIKQQHYDVDFLPAVNTQRQGVDDRRLDADARSPAGRRKKEIPSFHS